MKKIFAFAAASLLTVSLMAQGSPRWLRKSAISPDGKTVAFVCQGDIYTVSVNGGEARQITSNPAHDTDPIWTLDGKNIVFSSYRELSKDIWVISANGGVPKRLTNYSGSETPLAITADGYVLFSANIQNSPEYKEFPGSPQVYKVSLEGGRVIPVSDITMENISVNRDGVTLYEDYKGYEDYLRKHHTSSVTRDIWMIKDGAYTKVSSFKGEDRNPAFAADGDAFFYLSEQDGCFNVWKSSISTPSSCTQITRFTTHPVRNLSVATDGTLLFSWNGDLYTCKEGAEPSKLTVSVTRDNITRETVRRSIMSGVTAASVSPDGKEIALVAHGDVFVTSAEFTTTHRITNTPSQERGVSFSADGRAIYYAAERDGHWGIWRTVLTEKKDKYFTYSYNTKEELFSDPGQTCFQPSVSPDGKWVAFLRNRTDICIKPCKGGATKVLLSGVNYSYSDGDQSFEWSPDSHYILCDYMADGGWNNSDVALIDIETGKITNLTRSGYSDGGFHWAMGGKAMVWQSDKNGYRSHGSWGAENDSYAMFFDAKAFRDFSLDKEDEAIDKLLNPKEEKKKEKEEKKEEKDSAKVKSMPKTELDLDMRDIRTVRLTRSSSRMGDHYLTKDGRKLYYVSGGELFCYDIREKSSKSVMKGAYGRFTPDKEGKAIYIIGGSVTKLDLASGKTTSIRFNSEYDYKPAAEREYIFEHCWKQVDEKFYDPEIHGLDWKGMHDNYAQFLPYISNNYDFQELLSEMLGELNGSHTGGRYRPGNAVSTGHIGVLFDQNHTGEGLKIAEVLPDGALSRIFPEAKAGDMITAINGEPVGHKAWYEAFFMTTGKRIQITIKHGLKTENVFVKASGSDQALLYKRWVRQREEMVEKLSGGRVGYVHVEGMNSPSFREVYSKALGKYRTCDALIVDTRHNGGGWLHDDLATFLSGKSYIEWRPRGQYIGTEPYSKWTKTSCVLMGEDNYSDASGFPYTYKTLGIGKLIGAAVPGTMTAVWWETQIDNTMIFGIPQVTGWALKEDRPLENMQIEPDIEVHNDPASLLRGEDRQLEAAVAEMLKATK